MTSYKCPHCGKEYKRKGIYFERHMQSCSGTLPTSEIKVKTESDWKAFKEKIKERNKKIIIAGEGGVGRLTLAIRYTTGKFIAESWMTIGVEIFDKAEIIGDKKINFSYWVLGGQERFRFFISDFCRGADAAILAFDLTRPMTLENLGQWVEILRLYNPYLPILFVGTKLDLDSDIMVDDDYALQFKERFHLFDYFKVSTKTGQNVEKVFDAIFKCVLHKDAYEKLVESKRLAEFELKKKIEKRIPLIENLIHEGHFKEIQDELEEIQYDANKYGFTGISIKIKQMEELEKKKVIKKTVIDLGIKFQRLQIMEIAEECGMDADLIESVIQEMITNNEIYAKYFTSTKSVAFDQQANIDEIDALMEQYKKWEEEGISKK